MQTLGTFVCLVDLSECTNMKCGGQQGSNKLPLGQIILNNLISYHNYADNTQMYLFFVTATRVSLILSAREQQRKDRMSLNFVFLQLVLF